MKRNLMRAAIFLLLLPAALNAQEPTLDLASHYIVRAASNLATLQKDINEAAAAGYRVSATIYASEDKSVGGAVLLEKVATPPQAYEYLLLAGFKKRTWSDPGGPRLG